MPEIKTIEIDLCGAQLSQPTMDYIHGLCCQARENGAQGVTILIKRIDSHSIPRMLVDYGDRIHRVCEYVEKEMMQKNKQAGQAEFTLTPDEGEKLAWHPVGTLAETVYGLIKSAEAKEANLADQNS